MASLTINGFDDAIKQLEKMSRKATVDAAAKKAVDAAKGIVESSVRSSVSASEHGPRSTGSVAASISTTATKTNSYGTYCVTRPTGRDREGKRNAEKAAYLEYGTPNMAARPWRSRASSSAEGPCKAVIEQVIGEEFKTD